MKRIVSGYILTLALLTPLLTGAWFPVDTIRNWWNAVRGVDVVISSDGEDTPGCRRCASVAGAVAMHDEGALSDRLFIRLPDNPYNEPYRCTNDFSIVCTSDSECTAAQDNPAVPTKACVRWIKGGLQCDPDSPKAGTPCRSQGEYFTWFEDRYSPIYLPNYGHCTSDSSQGACSDDEDCTGTDACVGGQCYTACTTDAECSGACDLSTAALRQDVWTGVDIDGVCGGTGSCTPRDWIKIRGTDSFQSNVYVDVSGDTSAVGLDVTGTVGWGGGHFALSVGLGDEACAMGTVVGAVLAEAWEEVDILAAQGGRDIDRDNGFCLVGHGINTAGWRDPGAYFLGNSHHGFVATIESSGTIGPTKTGVFSALSAYSRPGCGSPFKVGLCDSDGNGTVDSDAKPCSGDASCGGGPAICIPRLCPSGDYGVGGNSELQSDSSQGFMFRNSPGACAPGFGDHATPCYRDVQCVDTCLTNEGGPDFNTHFKSCQFCQFGNVGVRRECFTGDTTNGIFCRSDADCGAGKCASGWCDDGDGVFGTSEHEPCTVQADCSSGTCTTIFQEWAAAGGGMCDDNVDGLPDSDAVRCETDAQCGGGGEVCLAPYAFAEHAWFRIHCENCGGDGSNLVAEMKQMQFDDLINTGPDVLLAIQDATLRAGDVAFGTTTGNESQTLPRIILGPGATLQDNAQRWIVTSGQYRMLDQPSDLSPPGDGCTVYVTGDDVKMICTGGSAEALLGTLGGTLTGNLIVSGAALRIGAGAIEETDDVLELGEQPDKTAACDAGEYWLYADSTSVDIEACINGTMHSLTTGTGIANFALHQAGADRGDIDATGDVLDFVSGCTVTAKGGGAGFDIACSGGGGGANPDLWIPAKTFGVDRESDCGGGADPCEPDDQTYNGDYVHLFDPAIDEHICLNVLMANYDGGTIDFTPVLSGADGHTGTENVLVCVRGYLRDETQGGGTPGAGCGDGSPDEEQCEVIFLTAETMEQTSAISIVNSGTWLENGDHVTWEVFRCSPSGDSCDGQSGALDTMNAHDLVHFGTRINWSAP